MKYLSSKFKCTRLTVQFTNINLFYTKHVLIFFLERNINFLLGVRPEENWTIKKDLKIW